MSKKVRNSIIAVAVLLVLVVGALLIRNASKPEAQVGGKTIVMTVVHGDGSQKDFTISTESENLRGALDEQELIEGADMGGFYMVNTVDGETADSELQQWWALSKDGEMTPTGVDDTMIADGEHYEFTLTTGW